MWRMTQGVKVTDSWLKTWRVTQGVKVIDSWLQAFHHCLHTLYNTSTVKVWRRLQKGQRFHRSVCYKCLSFPSPICLVVMT